MPQHSASRQFLASRRIAVAGASNDRNKYGNKVLRRLLENRYDVVPINPNARQVEGIKAYQRTSDIPDPVEAISIITPPRVSVGIVAEAIELGIRRIWLQPGAENQECLDLCAQADVDVLAGGPCLLIELP